MRPAPSRFFVSLCAFPDFFDSSLSASLLRDGFLWLSPELSSHPLLSPQEIPSSSCADWKHWLLEFKDANANLSVTTQVTAGSLRALLSEYGFSLGGVPLLLITQEAVGSLKPEIELAWGT